MKTKVLISFAVYTRELILQSQSAPFFSHMQNVGFLMMWLIASSLLHIEQDIVKHPYTSVDERDFFLFADASVIIKFYLL